MTERDILNSRTVAELKADLAKLDAKLQKADSPKPKQKTMKCPCCGNIVALPEPAEKPATRSYRKSRIKVGKTTNPENYRLYMKNYMKRRRRRQKREQRKRRKTEAQQ